jgi:hypothetical protein
MFPGEAAYQPICPAAAAGLSLFKLVDLEEGFATSVVDNWKRGYFREHVRT